MGMSASQARLLSITARLTDNELHSQLLTQAKIRLASESASASSEYIDSLSQTKLQMALYDDNGTATYSDLTANYLSTYEPLKNQYSILDVNGKNMVNSTDAKNYENTNDLYEFLSCYGITKTQEVDVQVPNPAHDTWVTEHSEWVSNEPQQKDFTKDDSVKRVHTSPIYGALTTTIATCFNLSVSGDNCFMHVLSALIGEGEHTPRDGTTYNVYKDKCAEHNQTWCWNTYASYESISESLRESLYTDKCSDEAYNDYVTTSYGRVKCTGDGSDSKKYDNVYQKLVDMLWEVHDEYKVGSSVGGLANSDSLSKFFYFVEFDLGDSYNETITVPDEDAYNAAHTKWQNSEPPEPAKTIAGKGTKVVISDKDKGQWYTNLWYQMNGSSTANILETKKADDGTSYYTVEAAEKAQTDKQNYKVLESNLTSSSDWLKYALENGIVTLKKTQVEDPAETSGSVSEISSKKITWDSII